MFIRAPYELQGSGTSRNARGPPAHRAGARGARDRRSPCAASQRRDRRGAAMRCTPRHVRADAHEEGVWCAAWVPGSASFLTGAVDERVRRWESTSEELKNVQTYDGQAGYTLGVVSVAVDPSGEWAASSALDSYVRVWSLRDHQERVLLESMPTEVWSVAFAPSRQTCVVAAAGGTRGLVKLWDISAAAPNTKAPALDPVLYELVRFRRRLGSGRKRASQRPLFACGTLSTASCRALPVWGDWEAVSAAGSVSRCVAFRRSYRRRAWVMRAVRGPIRAHESGGRAAGGELDVWSSPHMPVYPSHMRAWPSAAATGLRRGTGRGEAVRAERRVQPRRALPCVRLHGRHRRRLRRRDARQGREDDGPL